MKKTKWILACSLALVALLAMFCFSVSAEGTGDVAGAVEDTWIAARGQIKSVVNNVVFPVIDLILAVLFFVKVATAYMDYTWGVAKIIASLLLALAVPFLVLGLVFAGGLVLLRFGLAFADPRIIAMFNRVKYPYNISVATSRMVSELLESDIASQVAEIREQRTRLVEALRKLRCIEQIYPSDANFVLVRTDKANALYNALLQEGIITRNRTRMPLCEGCVRISIGTPDENTKLIESLEKYDAQWLRE